MVKRFVYLLLPVLFLSVLPGCRLDPGVDAGDTLEPVESSEFDFSGVEYLSVGSRHTVDLGKKPAEDVVVYWNAILHDVIQAHAVKASQDATGRSSYGPPWTSRNLAIINGAMYDALVSAYGTYEPYLVHYSAPGNLSGEVAALSAAYHATRELYPDQKKLIEAGYKSGLPKNIPSAVKWDSVKAGKIIASAYLNARKNDGSMKTIHMQPGTDIGEWRPTYPDYTPAKWAHWGQVKPFVMGSASAFDMPGPPPVSSAQYAADYAQVKIYGAADSGVRTPEQTEIARFWSYDGIEFDSCIVMLNQITGKIAGMLNKGTMENARLYALTCLTMADATIVGWKSKYDYFFWRPVTAIREGNNDGNPLTEGDPAWKPLGYSQGGYDHRTPAFPSCESGHSIFAGAYFTVLSRFVGSDNFTFSVVSDELPGVKRTFGRFSDAAREMMISRIYLGMHFLFDNLPAMDSGHRLGNFVYDMVLRPRS